MLRARIHRSFDILTLLGLLLIAGTVALATSSPPGVPSLEAVTTPLTALPPASENVLVLDRERHPAGLADHVANLPRPAHLVIGDRWITVADEPARLDAFRTALEQRLRPEASTYRIEGRLLEVDPSDPEAVVVLEAIRGDSTAAVVDRLVDAAIPMVTRRIAAPPVEVRASSPRILEIEPADPAAPTIEWTVTADPATEGFVRVATDLEVFRERAIGKRTDREGARIESGRLLVPEGGVAAMVVEPFASTSVRQLDGTLKILPREPSRSAAPMILVYRVQRTDAIPPLPDGAYRQGRATRDGIGRYYFGREIAQVMGHLGAGWLERPEREREERTSHLLGMLDLQPGMIVADIGAGSGYFTRRLSGLVEPGGRVVATDIQPEMLEILEMGLDAEGIDNVVPLLGTVDDTGLPPDSVDLILLVDVYHEFDHPWEMTRSMRRALRPGGRIALVEYRADDPRVPIKPLHTMTAEQSRLEFEAAGLRLVGEREDGLPWQRLQLFETGPVRESRRPASTPPDR